MNTEIPKEDGWYWIKRPCMITTIARMHTDETGWMLVVSDPRNPTSFTVHHTPQTLEGAIFERIEVPR